MPDYDLSRLSPRSFEQLIQSLAIKVLGPGIVVFGDGPDGGREATFEQKLNYPSLEDSWCGYGVIQAKYRQRQGSTQDNGNWAVRQLQNEIKKYTDPSSSLRLPDYFIYATNVVLTPVNKTGSKDRVIAVLEDFKKRTTLKGYAIWDYDQIRAFLDADQDVRTAHEVSITPGDVLARMIGLLEPTPSDLHATLVNFLEKEFLRDQFVNLGQAGHDSEESIPLATVFVDLPTSNEHERFGSSIHDDDFGVDEITVSVPNEGGFIKDILTASSERLDPASLGPPTMPNNLEIDGRGPSRSRYVLIGGPGQGKTTLTQFICQIFRSSIISQQSQQTLAPETMRALSIIEQHCEIEGIHRLVVPRFPFKIILSDFARALSPGANLQVHSVLGYLAQQVKIRTGRDVSVNDLRRFLSIYPSVMIFDGLDEVPASSNRDKVLDAIEDFWVDASGANADILAIATSRPQGYNADFAPQFYRHRQLAELSDDLSWHYAQRLAAVRYRSDDERRERVLGRLERAVHDESTSRLMRSPLQVTIMAALVERIGQPPQARWDLFRLYYDVIYDREVERGIPASNILREYRPDIRSIHNRVGLVLQIDSERTGRTDAKLSRERFVSLVQARLSEEGHEGDDLHNLSDQIVKAAAERLVFLVETESEQVGFEIRSLQEFMAAESLMDGVDQSIRRRLDEIAAKPFWRNVFLFAAGKCFAERQELREVVHAICAGLNETDSDGVAGISLTGSDLAIALLEEGSPRRQPKFENLLTRIAMRALDTADPAVQLRLANVYRPQLKDAFEDDLKLRLTGTSKVKSIGAWNCLLHLVARGVPWASALADKNWPEDQSDQIAILQSVINPTRNRWALDKILRIMPHAPVETFRMQFQFPSWRGRSLDRELTPEEDAAISVLTSGMRSLGAEFKVLGTAVSYGSLIRVAGGNQSLLVRFVQMESLHPSWNFYKWAGYFLQAPSKDSLSSALASIANDFDFGADDTLRSGYSMAPWPILACVASCANRRELLDLAEKAATGELGDLDDWLMAENRWSNFGITLTDVLAMQDCRLPFDSNIAKVGFPPALSGLPPVIVPEESNTTLAELVNIFVSLPTGMTRTFMARLINWATFVHLFGSRFGQLSDLPRIDVAVLQSIYQEIPDDCPVPFHVIVNLIGKSSHDVTAFFELIEGKNFVFDWGDTGDNQSAEFSMSALRRAYIDLGQPASLLRILGLAAEQGQLTGQRINIGEPQSFDRPVERLAAFVIMLSQVDWRIGDSERLIETSQRMVGLSRADFYRIVQTLEHSRSHGRVFDEFVVALKALVPEDDYTSWSRYVDLLKYTLGTRTSQFSNPSQFSDFALPEGIAELLAS